MSKGREFRHFLDMEEHQAGMWRKVPGAEADEWRMKATEHLKDSTGFRAAMRRALIEWPTSCLVAFTNAALNRPVWLAHAGACLEKKIPERFMREAYCALPDEEKDRADADAREIAAEWKDPRK